MERHLGGNLMKKKFMKSVLSITLVIVAVFTFSSAIMQRRWKYVSTISGDINISSLGIATVYGAGSAASTEVTKTVCKLHLQQLKKQKWTTIKTWTATSNMRYAGVDTKHWAVDRGYSYRICVELEAYKGNTLLETGSSVSEFRYYG